VRSFVCRRCGRSNARDGSPGVGFVKLEYQCDGCFADIETGRVHPFGRLMMSMLFLARLFVGTALTTLLILAPLVIAMPDRVASPLVRAAIALVPGLALGVLLWRRRRGK
jgi:hypothetical protein